MLLRSWWSAVPGSLLPSFRWRTALEPILFTSYPANQNHLVAIRGAEASPVQACDALEKYEAPIACAGVSNEV